MTFVKEDARYKKYVLYMIVKVLQIVFHSCFLHMQSVTQKKSIA